MFSDLIETADSNDSSAQSNTLLNIIGRLIIGVGGYKINLNLPFDFGANQSVIEIGYNETKTIQIGRLNVSKFNETEFKDIKQRQVFVENLYFSFIVTAYPSEYNDSWRVDFDPPILIVPKEGTTLVVNASISLTSPPIAENRIQSGILEIRVAQTQATGSFWSFIVEDNDLNFREFVRAAVKEVIKGNVTFFDIYTAVIFTLYFGATAGGSVSSPPVERMRRIPILVKVKPYHSVSFTTPENVELQPDQISTIPITLKNIGNYKDTFYFEFEDKNFSLNLPEPVQVTLRPGEEKETLLAVGAPPELWDPGTLHEVTIKAFSIYDRNVSIANQTIVIKTQGIYVSQQNLTMSIGFIFLFIIGIVLFQFMYKKKKKEMKKKSTQKISSEKHKQQTFFKMQISKLKGFFTNKNESKNIEKDKSNEKKSSAGIISKRFHFIDFRDNKQQRKKETEVKKKKLQTAYPKLTKNYSDFTSRKNVNRLHKDSAIENKKSEVMRKIRRKQDKQRKKIKSWRLKG